MTKKSNVLDKMPPKGPKSAMSIGGGGGNGLQQQNNNSSANLANNNNITVPQSTVSVSVHFSNDVTKQNS